MIDIGLDISVKIEDPNWQKKFPRLQKKMIAAIEAALLSQHKLKLKHERYELSVLLTTNTDVHKLNKEHRQKDKPTNILSFPMGTDAAIPGMPFMIGDMVLAHDIIETEAKADKKTFTDHFIHLIVHGTLHLCGYDHMTPGQARTMQRLENEILADFGIDNPYLPLDS